MFHLDNLEKNILYLLLAMEWMTEWWPNEKRNLHDVKRKPKDLYIGLDPNNSKNQPHKPPRRPTNLFTSFLVYE